MADNFIVYGSIAETVFKIDDPKLREEIAEAVLYYGGYGELPEGLSKMADIIMTNVTATIDGAKKTHRDKSKGGSSKSKKQSNEQSSEHSSEQSSEQLYQDEAEDEAEAKAKAKAEEHTPAPSASPSVLEREFESIWAEYPRRQERKDAFAAYCSARKRGTTAEQIAKGVRAYCAYIDRNQVDPKYVKQGGTFFRQQGWSDDWSGTFQKARSGTPRQGPDQAFPQRTDDLDALAVQLQIASSSRHHDAERGRYGKSEQETGSPAGCRRSCAGST